MTAPGFADPLTARLADFLASIGIPVRPGVPERPGRLPGLCVARGALLVDEAALLAPGDLLHEAGHLAILAPERRALASEPLSEEDAGQGMELAAIAWSWAALVHLGLPPEVLFHPHGYKGASPAFIANFSAGHFLGVPLLYTFGLSVEPHRARELGLPPFPHMLRWLRED